MRGEEQAANGAEPNRREFLKRSTALAVAGAAIPEILPGAGVHIAGSDEIRIGLVGCGGRGTGAAAQALNNQAGAQVRLVAVADAFSDRVERSLKVLRARVKDQAKIDVPPERRFLGMEGYRGVLAQDVDVVLLCTPPGFRPPQFEAAVDAGKHVFMEKPVATDAPGVRRVQAANAKAIEKGLAVAVGFHLRHETKHREVVDRIHKGAIGELMYMRAYFNSGGVWVRPRRPDQTEMQYQVRNWYYFTWLSGDHIVEQHVHDLDVANWIQGGHPIEAQGVGGRQVRVGPHYGEIYDHHTVEFSYPNGVKLFSYCRHMPNCWNSFSQHAHGTRGFARIEGHGRSELQIRGQKPQRWRRSEDGHQVEMDRLFGALRAGKTVREGDYGVTSSMTAILGRMATYSGKVVRWDDALASELDLQPKSYAWDAAAPVQPQPDGSYACAVPGVTRAW